MTTVRDLMLCPVSVCLSLSCVYTTDIIVFTILLKECVVNILIV